MKIIAKKDYAEERSEIYMEMGDQLDAVYAMAKHFKDKGEDFPEKVNQWMDDIEKVKARFPKK